VCGKALFANIVALGAIVALTHCVSDEALEKAVLSRVPKGTEEANKKALEAGKQLIN
ncbi:MAG: 2-oxoacid:acceptor oxidoreductase family protein, partial [Succiniclasticum sp.]|nr:2-oxoacid:acceptor oxidoreductase family protein [Succiniclasticum sp.]